MADLHPQESLIGGTVGTRQAEGPVFPAGVQHGEAKQQRRCQRHGQRFDGGIEIHKGCAAAGAIGDAINARHLCRTIGGKHGADSDGGYYHQLFARRGVRVGQYQMRGRQRGGGGGIRVHCELEKIGRPVPIRITCAVLRQIAEIRDFPCVRQSVVVGVIGGRVGIVGIGVGKVRGQIAPAVVIESPQTP